MKSKLAVIFFALLLSSSAYGELSSESNNLKYVTVGEYGAGLYASPKDSKSFKKIKKGKKLEVLDFQEVPSGIVKNTWFKVKYKKSVGWVSQHSLEGTPGKWYTRDMKYGGKWGKWVETKVP